MCASTLHDKVKSKFGFNGILLMAVCGSYLFTLIPLVLVMVQMYMIYTSFETILPWMLIGFSTGAFFIAYIAVIKQTSILYPFLYFGFNFLLATVFSIFTPIWIFVVILDLVAMIVGIKSTSSSRKFFPRFKSARAFILMGIALSSVGIPVLIYFNPPTIEYKVEFDDEWAPRNLEINFALANNSPMPVELYDILERCNNLPNINISVEIPILEEMIMNTSLLIGETMPVRDTFIKEKAFYGENRTAYEKDVNAYETAWESFTKKVRAKIDSMTYDELMGLDDSYFDQTGLVASQTRMLHDIGIAVDYMPLVEAEVYVNDNTIFRINKTLTLFHRWVEVTNMQTAHRGLIFDTEMDWNIRWNMILKYQDYGTHEKGLKALGDMVLMTKLWEWEWKGLQTVYGDYTPEKWTEYALEPRKTYVGSATFGMHLDDLWDLDDAQQNVLKISIATDVQATQFDFIGIMTYETGRNSEHAVYGYCRAGDYLFGEANVPYIYSGMEYQDYKDDPQKYLNEITRKFRIAQNYGYSTVGIWGLTHLYCFSEWGSGWCGGLYDFLKAAWTPEAIYWMCQNLTSTEPVVFTCDDFNFAYMHPALTLLDAYLVTNIRYGTWPINNNPRIRSEEFGDYPYIMNFIIGIGLSVMVFVFAYLFNKKFGFAQNQKMSAKSEK